MILALHLPEQLWPLLELIVAIFQPAMVLLLCAGLVLASTHLLAMLGTQWGNRRVTGKALIFSLAVHASLICAVVALIPEYQPQTRASFSSEERPIDITTDFEPEETSFDSQKFQSDATEIRPWEKIPTTLNVTPERTSVEAPQLTPQELARLNTPVPESATKIPEPQMAPQSTAEAESGQLAKIDEAHDYNPAAFEMPLDQVEVTPSAMASRAAPATVRSAPRNVIAVDSQLAKVSPRAASQLSPDFNPGIEENLESALPSPDAPALTQPKVEQMPQRQSPANFEVTQKDEALPNGGAASSRPQMAAPNQQPTRTTPRSVPKTDGELAAMSPGKPRLRPGQRPDGLDDPVLPDTLGDAGLEEALPELMKPQGLSPVPLANSTPAQYQLRSPEQREQAVEQFGGSEQSEAAVDRALKWLASSQDIEGYWDADLYGGGKAAAEGGIDRQFAGKDADTGVTALAVLAFLGKQNTLEEGEYSPQVNKALRWLVYQQGKSSQGIDGFLGGRASEIAGTYSHAMATFAMAEAYAMTKDQEKSLFLVEPLQKAVRYILLCQLEDGGWRYKRGQEGGGDMSIFGWQLMALKSAQAAGLEIPLSTREKMINFLQRRALGRAGGLAGYREKERPSLAMTAESLFCKQMLGQPREHPACEEAVNYLLTNPPTRRNLNLYAWYYSTLALYQYGGEPWDKWNGRLRDLLIAEQVTEGEFAGSWEPRDPWGGYGGRIYSTAFATLTLEVYYRYLPLYRKTAPAPDPTAPRPAEPETR